ncbi:MAG TPA: S8 family serine peptidase [Bacteroidota bacterium]|nr:S8 family serine peptidase [Bacteroidota bacterium]
MKTKNIWLITVIALMTTGLHDVGLSQTTSQVQALKDQSARLSTTWQLHRSAAEQKAAAHGLPVRFTSPRGVGYELENFSGAVPQYFRTLNLDAAKTIGTARLWPTNPLGVQLSGQNIVLGLWDEARVLATHQEFTGGRITQVDNPTSYSNHSTHVAGTMIASGVNAQAHGMAPRATIRAYDWNNDLSEMASEASSGLRVSSHSYGYVRGWDYNAFGDGLWAWFGDVSVSQDTDYAFGFYDDEAEEVDQIALNAPNYLIVRAAGNDRADTGPSPGTSYWYFVDTTKVLGTTPREPDGGALGYDCIADAAIAKNVITVGAVNDIPQGYATAGDVVMTSFSSWGPADDGRIKPDIVANGYQLTSSVATGTAAYDIYSGTSMATPCISGSVGLILENEKRLYGSQQFRSSTIKGLIIHTADEAGSSPGPDYSYGWGLMNTYRAIDLMDNDKLAGGGVLLREVNLLNDSTVQIAVKAKGTEPLRATICWIDPPGGLLTPAVDQRTPSLVNDVDLRIVNGSTVYFPWKLDPKHPANAAVQADNSVDNVEQVLIASPVAGNYTIKISHKGTLTGGHQVVSLIISGIQATSTTPSHFTFTSGTGNNGTVSIPVSASPKIGTTSLSPGDEIGAFTPQGLCVGAIVWTGQNQALTVWGDNDQTTSKDGLAANDTIRYRIWQSSTGTEFANTQVTYTQGDGLYATNGIYVVASMTATAGLAVPVLTSPANGASGVVIPATLQWYSSTGAVSYKVQVAKDTSFGTKVVDTSGMTTTSLQVRAPKLSGGTTYYWRVQAVGSSQTSGWSPRWQFATGISPVHFSFTSGTGNNGTVSIPVLSNPKVGSTPLSTGDEIGAFTPEGLCVGAIVWTGQNQALTVWGDNDQTTAKDGLAAGDTIKYRIWQSSTNTEYANTQVTYTQGSGVYAVNGIYVIGSMTGVVMSVTDQPAPDPSTFVLAQNYPNPFNPSTTIGFSLPARSVVLLQVINTLGEEVTTLVKGELGPGYHEVLWNGRVSSGIYFYRLTATAIDNTNRSFVQVKKMVLMR